jgi:MFS family permease
MTTIDPSSSPPWVRMAIGGSSALFVGMGLGRFSYAPMIPILIEENALSPAEAGYVAAFNLAGFLFGVLLQPALRTQIGERGTLRLCLYTGLACLIASAAPLPAPWLFPWLAFWRGLIGVAVGTIMVQALAVATRTAPPDKLGLVTGIVFTGVGGGIFLSGVAIPALLDQGLTATWIAVAVIGAGAVAVGLWAYAGPIPEATAPKSEPSLPSHLSGATIRLAAAQSLFVIGLIPHTIFWVDYIVRGLHHPMTIGGIHWALFGLGALVGTALWGRLADQIGFRTGLILVFTSLAIGLIAPVVHPVIGILIASSLVVGAQPGCSALLSGRTQQIFGNEGMSTVWRHMTLIGSIGQGLGGYLLVALFDATGSYAAIFLIGSAAMASGALISATIR